MKHIEFAMTATDNLDLFGRRWLPDNGSPKGLLCLVHGYGEHTGRYHHVAHALTDAGYAVIGFDQRGHGESGGARGYTPSYDEQSLDDIATFVAEARRQIPDLPTFMYGHSMGGGMTLGYVLRRAPKGLAGAICTSPWLRLTRQAPRWQATMVRVLSRIRPGGTISTKSKDAHKPITAESEHFLSRDLEMEEAFRVDPHRHDTMSYRLLQSAADNGEWVLGSAPAWPIPMLLVHGDNDMLTSVEATREFVERAPSGLIKYREWPGGYHELHNDIIRDELFAAMIEWLDNALS